MVLLRAEDLRGLCPDLGAVAELPVGGLIVTAPGDGDGIDFISRYFAPPAGIDEDPVTGSAHCTLIDYWADRLQRTELIARQSPHAAEPSISGTKVTGSSSPVTPSPPGTQNFAAEQPAPSLARRPPTHGGDRHPS